MNRFVLLLLLLTAITVAEQTQLAVDSVTRDSAETSRIRELLETKLLAQKEHLYYHPETIDSLFSVEKVSRYRIERQDYATWSDLLYHPFSTAVFYTPNSHLNRILPMGYTFPQRESRLLNGIQVRTIPTTTFEPLWVKSITISPDGRFTPEYQTGTKISPELFINSETGLFNGNSLELRFLRNLTRNLSLGVFSSYRELKRTTYSHNNGSMYNMFKGWGLKEEDLSNTGYNPQAISHLSTIALHWQNRSIIDFTFTYGDLRNDQVYTFPLNTKDTVWFIESDFLTKFQGSYSDTLFSDLKLKVEGQYSTNKHFRSPQSKNEYLDTHKDRGTTDYAGFGGSVLIPDRGIHNLSAQIGFNKNSTDRYNRKHSSVYQGDLYIYDSLSMLNDKIHIFLGGGPTLIHSKGIKKRVVPRYLAKTKITIKNATVRGYIKSEVTPTFINYDTATVVVPFDKFSEVDPIEPFTYPTFYGDTYLTGGISAYFSRKQFSLFGGYNFLAGIEETLAQEYWAQGYAPYTNPTHQLFITPSLFFNNKVMLSSNTTISDTKPYFRNNSRIRFHINRYKATRHFYIDIFNRYWSEREPVTFGDTTGWNKPVNDIGLKLTAEIRSFRIFYKMENLINRNNSYVPGYEMPGFIIRWGFNWTITG